MGRHHKDGEDDFTDEQLDQLWQDMEDASDEDPEEG